MTVTAFELQRRLFALIEEYGDDIPVYLHTPHAIYEMTSCDWTEPMEHTPNGSIDIC